MKVGILGCGAIAPAYLETLTRSVPGVVDVVACADLVAEAAAARAVEYAVPRACGTEELLSDPTIEIVVNLTQAPAHHATSLQVLEAGKHLFTEKPLALSRADAMEILEAAESRELLVAGAADTFLGPAIQRARTEVEAGAIGVPIAAIAVLSTDGFHDRRYHDVFRGALLDLGPYHLGGLTYLLGPVTRVAASAEIRFAEKPCSADDPEGPTFPVDQPTTTAAVLDFATGPVGALVATQDVHSWAPWIEIRGTEGTLRLPDPVYYGGALHLVSRAGAKTIRTRLPSRFRTDARGLGVLDLASALREARAPRASSSWMYHVLDVSLAHVDSSRSGRHVEIASTFERPSPLAARALSVTGARPAASGTAERRGDGHVARRRQR